MTAPLEQPLRRAPRRAPRCALPCPYGGGSCGWDRRDESASLLPEVVWAQSDRRPEGRQPPGVSPPPAGPLPQPPLSAATEAAGLQGAP